MPPCHSLLGPKCTLYSFKKPALALAALLAQACAKFSTEMGPELEEGEGTWSSSPCFQSSLLGRGTRARTLVGVHRTPVPGR